MEKRTMSFPRSVLWKAEDGREFRIDTKREGLKTMEALYKHIDKLRKEHGYKAPDFMGVMGKPGVDVGQGIDYNDLPESAKKDVAQALSEVKPDPKTLN
jgi:hypothetical protein